MKNISYISIFVGIGIILIVSVIILDVLGNGYNKVKIKSNFADIAIPTTEIYEKNRTLLYGSLFLDKLNEQIKELTDPKIQYDEKRIDIIKYSDVLM